MSPEAIIRAFTEIIRHPEVVARVEAEPEGALAELGLDEATRAGMLSHGVGRLLAYHRMVHGRLRRTVRALLGRAGKVLGRERLDAEVDAWISAVGPSSGLFREVVVEFATWAVPRWAADDNHPAWLAPLARHDVLIWSLRNDPRPVGEQSEVKIDLERPVACNPTAQIQRYAWAVHAFPRAPEPGDEPEAREVAVVVYRHTDDRVRELELAPRPAALLGGLLAGQSLRDALFGACAATGEALDDEVLGQTALALADWVDRHILLGGTE